MRLCFHHYSPGKNSNLNAPVLLRQDAAPLSHCGAQRDENVLQKAQCFTLLTFPVLPVYKQLWSPSLWALCTSQTRTDGGASCLNEAFLTCLHCGSQTHIYLSSSAKAFAKVKGGNTQWWRYDGVLSSLYRFSHTVCSATKNPSRHTDTSLIFFINCNGCLGFFHSNGSQSCPAILMQQKHVTVSFIF